MALTAVKGSVGAYLASLLSLGKARLTSLAVLVAVGAMVEGLGILLLVPLVGVIFGGEESGPRPLGSLEPYLPDVGRGNGQLALILGLFLLLLAVRGIILWQRDTRLMRLSLEMVDLWRGRLIRAVAAARWQRIQELRPAHIEFAAASEVNRLAIGSDRLLRGGVALVQLIIALAFAVRLAPGLTAVAALLLLATVPVFVPIIRRAHAHGSDLSRDGRCRQGMLREFLAGMKLAKAHEAQDHYAREFISLSDALRARTLGFAGQQFFSNHATQLIAAIAAAVVLFVGLAISGTPPAILSALLVLLARIVSPAQQLMQGWQALLAMLPAVDGLLEIERSLASPLAARPESRLEEAGGNGAAAISFRDLCYRATDRAEPILDGVSGTIPAGSFAVLSGASGSGKTSLADILIGLIDPQSGQVALDGCALASDEARAAWRRRIGYVPQDPYLFDASVRENMAWADPGADDAALWRALRLAEAEDFVRALPHGFDTQVGDRGTHLSGGERQRICLARALLRRPRLLLLDEATSALDRATEDRLLQTLAKLRGDLTILMITHRPPGPLRADLTLHLAAGRLTVESAVRPQLAAG